MGKLFQIHEADLADLEHTLPEIVGALTPELTGRLRVQLRRVQTILSNIRWNYGPPTDVEVIRPDEYEGEDDAKAPF